MPLSFALETTRLILRPWCPADIEPFHAVCSDPQVMHHVGSGVPWSREQTNAFIDTAIATQEQLGYCRWAVIDKAADRLIGFCGFVPTQDGGEIGWRLAVSAWGRGLATEAAQAALNYGFENLRFPRVTATVQSGNAASLRVTEKLGLQYQNRFQRAGRDVLVFALANPSPRSPLT